MKYDFYREGKALFGIFVLDFFASDGSQALSQLQSQTADLKQ